MKWKNVQSDGYVHDTRIYYAALTAIIAILVTVVIIEDISIIPTPYLVCDAPQCHNPFYYECQHSIKFIDYTLYKVECAKESWLAQEYLPTGVYGLQQPPILSVLSILFVIILLIAFGFNHYTHNKGKTYHPEIRISKKHRIQLGGLHDDDNRDS